MNTIALREQRWGDLLELFKRIQSSVIFKKIVLFLKLSFDAIKTGDNTSLKNYMVELASEFFNVEVEEEPEKKPNKKKVRKKIVKQIFKVIVFPVVIIYIAIALIFEKNKKKVKNKNIYVKT